MADFLRVGDRRPGCAARSARRQRNHLRWCWGEEEADYRITFLGDAATLDEKQRAGTTILLRYLEHTPSSASTMCCIDILSIGVGRSSNCKVGPAAVDRMTVPAFDGGGRIARFATPISFRGMT
ncbi:MAG: hypothetical protein U0744_09050 [Gemmataceae bacterium]